MPREPWRIVYPRKVLVALALGWTQPEEWPGGGVKRGIHTGGWYAIPPRAEGFADQDHMEAVPAFDGDIAWAWPYVVKLGMCLGYDRLVGLWRAYTAKPLASSGSRAVFCLDAGWPGPTLHPDPLVAICEQVLALERAGKLKALLS